jgi:hypothetical protein
LCFKFKDLGAYRQHCGQIHYLAQLLRDITSLENGKCYYVLAVIFFVFFSCRFLPAIFLASCYFIHSVFCPRSETSLSHLGHSLRHQSPAISTSIRSQFTGLLSKFACQHGPAILLTFGSRRALSDSSPSIAEECFTNLAWPPRGDCWRKLRKILYKSAVLSCIIKLENLSESDSKFQFSESTC